MNALLQTLVFPGLLFLLTMALLYEWFDRKIVVRFQSRYGPFSTGPRGILQPLADFIKLLSKEDIVPRAAGRLFTVAPIFILTLSVMPLFYMPIVNSMAIASFEGDFIIILFLATLRVALILLSGTSSGSKFAEVGGTRAGLQMLGYSIPLTLTAIGPAVSSGSLSLSSIWVLCPCKDATCILLSTIFGTSGSSSVSGLAQRVHR